MPTSEDQSPIETQRPRPHLTGWLTAAAVAAASVGLGALAVITLQQRAAAQGDLPERPLLTVETATIERRASYTVEQSFVGRIEPAREVAASFERAGLVREIIVDEGDPVKRDQSIATLDIDALEIEDRRLAAERVALEADLDLAEATMERREALQGRGFESSQSFDEAKFLAEAIKARLGELDARRNRVALDIEKSTIKAPFDGVVSQRRVDEGAVVAIGAPVLVLQETTRPQARIGAPVDVADTLAVGDVLALTVGERTTEGTIASISPSLDPATRTVAVLVDLPAALSATMGDVVRLRVARDIKEGGAWVPLAALREAARGLWSLQTLVERDGATTLSSAVVEVLHVRDGEAFVRGPLRDGAIYVVAAPHRGAQGQPVTVAEPQATADLEDQE